MKLRKLSECTNNTFQERVRSTWPATYEARPESFVWYITKYLVRRLEQIYTFLQFMSSSVFRWPCPSCQDPGLQSFSTPDVEVRWICMFSDYICRLENSESKQSTFHPYNVLGSVVILAPIFNISFSAAKPWSVNSECNSLKASHFSPFHELPHYIPVLVDLMETMIHAKVSLMNTTQAMLLVSTCW